MAVLDDRLKVRGYEGLRVIDASMMPNIISGNTNAVVLAVADKAATSCSGALSESHCAEDLHRTASLGVPEDRNGRGNQRLG
jgi:choline dehydrogenase-like flavoprotein